MALEEDIPDQPDDKTVPKYKQIDKVTKFPPSHPSLLLSPFPKNILLPVPPTNPLYQIILACRFIHNLLGP